MLIIDSSAWIELIGGTEKGKKVLGLIENNSTFAMTLNLAEVVKWCEKNGKDGRRAAEAILEMTEDLLAPSFDALVLGGRLAASTSKGRRTAHKSISIIDCLLAATANENQLRVLTSDRDFERLGCEAIIL
ncbi:MAG: PIN domain-containing protein [Candidatus Micrarchaeota archaeon]